ncbi:hypothetical protein Acid7E03_17270 [Acidisoma sp. 7E03]
MRHDVQMLELHGSRAGDGIQGLACRVGDEVEVEPVRGHLGIITGEMGIKGSPNRWAGMQRGNPVHSARM